MTEYETSHDSLNIIEPINYDNSIESWQYNDYTPQNQANLNMRGSPIEININASDVYMNTSKSYLVIKGQLVRNDNNNPYDANAEVALVNNP